MRRLFSQAFSWYSANINKILFYTCSITLLLLFLERLSIIFSYEAHTAGIDNNFDYPIIRWLAGYSMYPNPSDYPFAVNPYAPLFFIISKHVASAFHINPANTIAVYRISRSVALLADIGTCTCLFFILKRLLKASRYFSISTLCLFFGITCYLGYTINRSDSLFLFFYVTTILFLLKTSSKKSFFYSLAIAIMTTLCVYSKQNGIILLLLVPAWFAMEKDYKSLLRFIFFLILFGAGSFIYLEYYYTNHYFSEHIIHALKNKIDPRWFYIYVFKLMAPSYITLPLAASFVISVKSISESNNPLLKKLGALFILQFLFSSALCLKWGSSQGYYNESFLLGSILITVFYTNSPILKLPELIKRTGIYIYPAILLFAFHITMQLYFFYINGKPEAMEKFNEQVLISNYIKKEIGTQNRYVIDLSNPDFNFFKNILYKECAAPNIDAVNCCTLPGRIFDYSGLLTGLKTGKVLFLIEIKGNRPDMLWGVDIRHYRIDTSFNNYSLYKYDSSKLEP